MNEFKDRIGPNINKKSLEVSEVIRDESGEITSMTVVVSRCDTEDTTQEGTALNANNLTSIISEMINTEINKEINTIPFTDEQKVASDKTSLEMPLSVTDTLNLPIMGNRNCSISWSVVSGTGIAISNNVANVNQTLLDQTATIKATISSGNITDTKDFEIAILKREMTDIEKVRYDIDSLVIPTNIVSGFSLPSYGIKGSSITWT